MRDSHDTGITEEAASHWHFSNILSRLRRAMFHTLLGIANDSSSGSNNYHELAVNKHRRSPRHRHSVFHELAARTLGELAGRPHERGYLLVATATDAAVELPGALELLRRYVSSRAPVRPTVFLLRLVVASEFPRVLCWRGNLIGFFRGLFMCGESEHCCANRFDLDQSIPVNCFIFIFNSSRNLF